MTEGVQCAIEPKNYGVFLLLRIAEITDAPEHAGHLFPVDSVGFVNANLSTQVFAGDGVKGIRQMVHQDGRAVITRRVYLPLTHEVIGDSLRLPCTDFIFEQAADLRRLHFHEQNNSEDSCSQEKAK